MSLCETVSRSGHSAASRLSSSLSSWPHSPAELVALLESEPSDLSLISIPLCIRSPVDHPGPVARSRLPDR